MDPVLPGVIVEVVGDMRHVESVNSRTIAEQDRQMVCVISGATHSMCMGFLVRVHRGALCVVGVLQLVLLQIRWVWPCCALLRRDLALWVCERSGL